MSGARLTGGMPRPGQIMGIVDEHAKLALLEARVITEPFVEQEAPGDLGAAMRGSVRKTATGHRMRIQAPRGRKYKNGKATVAQVARWVNRGTGLYRRGPGAKRAITSKSVVKPMVLPGGRHVRFVRGQHPNPFIARAEIRALIPARQAIEAGRDAAVRALRKL